MFASKDIFLTPPSGGYSIARSVRLRSSATAYFNRTPASAGNRRTFTISAWVKRGTISDANLSWLFGAGATDETNIYFRDSDILEIRQVTSGSEAWKLSTTQVFRDPSAWYHFVFSFDTTQATASNRIKVYVNGIQITSFSTASYPAQNNDTYFNNNVAQYIGKRAGGSTYFDGYLTEINSIDGQALTPSSFGETDSITGVWKPKAYSGTYGTNGFELNFSDNSNNTAATIGKDYSGNGNNWTPNNISVTAGATYDSMQDVPTLTSATAANYCVMNPLIKSYASQSWALTNGNLQATDSGSGGGWCLGTIAATSGKWYWEGTITANAKNHGIGWTTIGNISFGYNGCYTTNGNVNNASGSLSTTFATYTTNDVIGVAVDVSSGKVWFSKNGTFLGSGDPVAGTNTAFTFTGGTESAPTFCIDNSAGTSGVACNFGQRPFSYTPPTGFVALNTYNLPASTIKNGAAYMAATTFTGNGTTQTVTNTVNGISFQPDLVWQKRRDAAGGNYLVDSVRGSSLVLTANDTSADSSSPNFVTGFNSNGWSLGTNNYTNGSTVVGWQWKAGGTSASNTNGSITSTVSAGATQGFSVVTYTGTGANATVGHGLGVAPAMYIVKRRTGGIGNWAVWHTGLSNTTTSYILLDSTSAQSTSTSLWGSTAATSTTIGLGTSVTTNNSSDTYVVYCFSAVAGYSAFGSYVGNSSSDGPFLYTGFRPRWVMLKVASGQTGEWLILDTSRDTYNTASHLLYANSSAAEDYPGGYIVDILSNGFKLRNSSFGFNNTSGTYIWAAFAESPFKTSLAR